jgi:hypothetical protein
MYFAISTHRLIVLNPAGPVYPYDDWRDAQIDNAENN